jgi:hypothetical protein
LEYFSRKKLESANFLETPNQNKTYHQVFRNIFYQSDDECDRRPCFEEKKLEVL